MLKTLRTNVDEKKIAERKKREREQALRGTATGYQYIIRVRRDLLVFVFLL